MPGTVHGACARGPADTVRKDRHNLPAARAGLRGLQGSERALRAQGSREERCGPVGSPSSEADVGSAAMKELRLQDVPRTPGLGPGSPAALSPGDGRDSRRPCSRVPQPGHRCSSSRPSWQRPSRYLLLHSCVSPKHSLPVWGQSRSQPPHVPPDQRQRHRQGHVVQRMLLHWDI